MAIAHHTPARLRVRPAIVPLTDVCAELGVDTPTLLRWSANGEFPRTVKLGKRHYVPRQVYAEWLREIVDPPTTP